MRFLIIAALVLLVHSESARAGEYGDGMSIQERLENADAVLEKFEHIKGLKYEEAQIEVKKIRTIDGYGLSEKMTVACYIIRGEIFNAALEKGKNTVDGDRKKYLEASRYLDENISMHNMLDCKGIIGGEIEFWYELGVAREIG